MNFHPGDLAAYARTMRHFGLNEPFDFGSIDAGARVKYRYDDFEFDVEGVGVVHDWTLSPADLDKMIQMARATEKADRIAERAAKKAASDLLKAARERL